MKTPQILLTVLILLIVSCSACKNDDTIIDPQLRNAITFKISENGGDAKEYAIFEAALGAFNGVISAYVEGQPRVLTMSGGTTEGTYAFSLALPDVGKDAVGTYLVSRSATSEGEMTWAITKNLGAAGVLSMLGTTGELVITKATDDGEVMRISGTFSLIGTDVDGGTFSITEGEIDRLPVRKAF